MIIARYHPRSREALFELVKTALAGARIAVAQAGHFLLHQADEQGAALPCIASELEGSQFDSLRREHGQFPELSWRLAQALLRALPLEQRYLLVLVNDWQYAPDPASRDRFYKEHTTLPAAYQRVFEATSSDTVGLLTPRGSSDVFASQPYFSERVLRNSFHRRMKKLTAVGALPPGAVVTQDAGGATCSVMEVMGQKQEIYCSSKSADCSGEVAQMIDQAHDLVSCDTFINFLPSVCERFVELGSELPSKLFGTKIKRVVNIALPSTGVATEQDLLDEAAIAVHAF